VQTLEILKQLGRVKTSVHLLMEDKIDVRFVELELELLKALLNDSSPKPQENHVIEKNILQNPPPPTAARKKSPINLYLNESNTLLYELEESTNGVALQEPRGFVIFVPNFDLDRLTPVNSKIVDANGLSWDVTMTHDENVLKVSNDIGDTIIGMKAVQDLINGTETMEFTKL